MARNLLRTRRFIAQKVLHAGDTPHTIALGAAIAMFIAFLPLIGLQTIVAVAIAALFRANKAVCIPIVWITNPFTAVPVYSVCLYIGRLLLASPQDDTDVEVLNQLGEQEANGLFDAEFWMNLLKQLATLGTELWLGCAIVGVVAAILSYFAARWAVIAYREKRRLRELRRTLFRAQLQDDRASQRSGAV